MVLPSVQARHVHVHFGSRCPGGEGRVAAVAGPSGLERLRTRRAGGRTTTELRGIRHWMDSQQGWQKVCSVCAFL